jgi:hypothetical protein
LSAEQPVKTIVAITPAAPASRKTNFISIPPMQETESTSLPEQPNLSIAIDRPRSTTQSLLTVILDVLAFSGENPFPTGIASRRIPSSDMKQALLKRPTFPRSRTRVRLIGIRAGRASCELSR